MPSRTGEQLVGFAAVVLPRPAGRGTWRRVRFYFGEDILWIEAIAFFGAPTDEFSDFHGR